MTIDLSDIAADLAILAAGRVDDNPFPWVEASQRLADVHAAALLAEVERLNAAVDLLTVENARLDELMEKARDHITNWREAAEIEHNNTLQAEAERDALLAQLAAANETVERVRAVIKHNRFMPAYQSMSLYYREKMEHTPELKQFYDAALADLQAVEDAVSLGAAEEGDTNE